MSRRTLRTGEVLSRAARIESLERRMLLSLSPTGSEFRVNTFTTGAQDTPAVASDADGDFVVVWSGNGSGDGNGVFAQRYNSAGVAQGAEFRVNSITTNPQRDVTVAMDADGDFVVAWESLVVTGNYDIFAQRYNAAGVPQGGEFRANTFTTSVQENAAVAMDAGGNFAITWMSFGQQSANTRGIYAQRYSAAGVAQGGEMHVNTITTDNHRDPTVAMDADGDFVIVWASDASGITAQRYHSGGATVGGEFNVNNSTTTSGSRPTVAMDADGDFVVIWNGNHVFARRFDSGGVAQGLPFAAATFTTGFPVFSSVAMDSTGDFLVSWENDRLTGSSYDTFAQSFNAAGVPQGSEFRVNAFTTNRQRIPAVAMDSDGDAVIAWNSLNQDSANSYGVYAQRYDEAGGPFTVTNANDAGAGSLRQAIIDANAFAGPDDINFDPGFFSVPRTITLLAASGQLSVTDSVNIAGPGTSILTVSGGNAVRVFNIAGTGILNVTISGMRITGGNGTTNGTTAADGGGILTTDEAITLNNVIVSGNVNTGANDGGGVAASGAAALTVRSSTISGNTSGGDGGGMYFFSGGSLLLENSTVSGNTAPGTSGGGGIYFFGTVAAGGFTVRNSTIANNAATTASGGGIVFRSLTANVNPVVIQNSTITGNSAGTASATVGQGGGGIAVSSGTANSIISLVSTIVSGNTSTAANGRSDIAAIALATINLNFCAVGDPDGFTPSGSSSNNLPFGSALNLLSLGDYGGPTQTVALTLGSLAVNAGSNPAGLTTDQRGAGFPRVLGAATDIGAFEGALDIPNAGGTFANVTTAGGTNYTFQVTYGGATSINVSTLDNNDIRVTGPNGFNQLANFVSASPPVNATPVVGTYRITPPGGSFDPSDFGTYTIAVEPSQVANTSGGFVPAGSVGTFQVLIPTTFTVTNQNDAGPGSLRQAILDSNVTPGATDTIVFQSPLLRGSAIINLAAASGQLNITDSVTILGPGAGNLTVSGQDAIRVFNVENTTSVITVNISGMTISGGNGIPVSGGTASDGGGVRITDENVTLDGVVIAGNTVGGTNDGGGIGITAAANLVIRNSTVSGNSCADSGGGIYFFSGGSLLLENSTVSGNTAPGVAGGGGIYFFGTVPAGGFTIRNSTIANNSATNATATGVGGGGIVLRTFTGTALIQNSTISGNTSASTSATDGLGGGGIALATGSAASILTLQNTIVAGNTSANLRPDISAIAASTVNANFSLVGVADTFTLSATSDNNLTGTLAAPLNPMLGSLADNGGPTQTMLPDATSPVINAGSNTLIPVGLTTDQRGPGFPRIQGGTVDIGAVERTIALPPTVANAVFNFLTSQSLVFTFDQAVNFPNGLAAAFVVHNDTTNTNVPFNAVQNDPTMVTLTPTGSPAIFPDGDYTATVVASNVQNASGMNLAANFIFNFFFLNGDANRDRDVDLDDFNVLATNFNTFGKTFSQGNFSYDAAGSVNLDDFNILASRFNTALSVASVRSAGAFSKRFVADDHLSELLV